MKLKISLIAVALMIPHLASAYTCTIEKYHDGIPGDSTVKLAGPFQVELNGKLPDQGGVGIAAEAAIWYVTRSENMISAELRDNRNNSVAIASSEEGAPLRLKIPGLKQILNCNAPGKSNFVVDPSAYNGESMILMPTHRFTKYPHSVFPPQTLDK